MRITRQVTKEVTITIDALCNQCGESCIPKNMHHGTPIKWDPEAGGFVEISEEEHLIERGPELYGLIEQTVEGGCSSSGLNDMTRYTFSLCELCLKKMFDGFKIPVDARDYND